MSEPQRIAILAEGLFDDHHAKTAHGVIRYGERPVVAVIDSHLAGREADDVVPFCARPVPIVATLEEAVALGAQRVLVGVATTGGVLPEEWRPLLLGAIEAGLDLEAGLHTLLSDDPELSAAAQGRGVELRDLRLGPGDLDLPHGLDERPAALRVVHSVGSDCVIGKKAITLELDAAARAPRAVLGLRAHGADGHRHRGVGHRGGPRAVGLRRPGPATGSCATAPTRADLLWLEGQGALFHPAYSAVTLGLLHGSRPDALVLAHKAGARVIHNYPEVELPPLGDLATAYEAICRPVRPTRVLAVALNTVELDEHEARRAVDEAEAATGLVADDAVRFGSERLLDAVLAGLDGS